MIPELTIDGNRLTAVPAVHYRAPFAEAVNRQCRQEHTRPAAVAVELGAGAVRAIAAWLAELGVGRATANGQLPLNLETAQSLPSMLGLATRNRFVHPKHQAKAARLQEIHGCALHDISPAILREQVDFSSYSLICLSATDSIIEAIRSAVELGLPVYGVDLESFSHPRYPPGMIEDPIGASLDLSGYVERNHSLAADGHDEWIDERRERVMAARLKLLVAEHRSVLFTGGIGHWSRLRQRMLDPDTKPARGIPTVDPEQYLRALVDPVMAIHQMDVFPSITARYETLRAQPVETRCVSSMYRSLLAETLDVVHAMAQPSERDSVVHFARYLANLCLVGRRKVPTLIETVNAAETMISRTFAERLGEELVAKALRWATPDNWPNLPFLRAAPLSPHERSFVSVGRKGRIIAPDFCSPDFYVPDRSGDPTERLTTSIPSPVSPLPKEQERGSGGSSSVLWVWPPWEYLACGLRTQALVAAIENTRTRCPEPFAGSLHAGVDTKATLRAFARNDRRIQVRWEPLSKAKRAVETPTDPGVYLFTTKSEPTDNSWSVLRAGDDLTPYLRNRTRYEQVTQQEGEVFVASVNFGQGQEPEPKLRPWVANVRHLSGALIFGLPSVNASQAARWVESADYQGFPILRNCGMHTLVQHYREHHGIDLEEHDWMSRLILIGLPYARERLVVIAPNDFQVSRKVRQESLARRIRVEVFPLKHFPTERITALQQIKMVRVKDEWGTTYDEGIEAALGESCRAHVDTLTTEQRALIGET